MTHMHGRERLNMLHEAHKRLVATGVRVERSDLRIELPSAAKWEEVRCDLVLDLDLSDPDVVREAREKRPRIMGIPVHIMDESRSDEDCRLVLSREFVSRSLPDSVAVVETHRLTHSTLIQW